MRYDTTIRQWRVLQAIDSSRRGISAKGLAERLNIPLRTVYRDLECLQYAGFPLYADRSGNADYWKLELRLPGNRRADGQRGAL